MPVAVTFKFYALQVISDSFTLTSLPCSGGYHLTSVAEGNMICTCADTTEEIVFCAEDQDSVILMVSEVYVRKLRCSIRKPYIYGHVNHENSCLVLDLNNLVLC